MFYSLLALDSRLFDLLCQVLGDALMHMVIFGYIFEKHILLYAMPDCN